MSHSASRRSASRRSTLDTLFARISKLPLSERQRCELIQLSQNLREETTHIMIVGATGCGKSSTINALFGDTVATVGVTPNPETQDIDCYDLGGLVLWDTPGLGDGVEEDERHRRNIVRKLRELDGQGRPLIDAVLVILNGAVRDFGTSYAMINDVILPEMQENGRTDRVIVAVNKADSALGGRHWNFAKNRPDAKLEAFLNEQAQSVHERILASTGVSVDPVWFSAGYSDGEEQSYPYNLSKLYLFLMRNLPAVKRIKLNEAINQDKEAWQQGEDNAAQHRQIQRSWEEAGRDFGEMLGRVLGCGNSAVEHICASIGGWLGSLFD